ncbi:MAG: YebC/PmpR family DNA-binding transcriptional regulator [Amoebophilaceae bacterium]|jgi:YebC/PmpR family DNA-binding regulatory protein|nr:YebC/PmpR family DNA-binding transcriptional regulator [Amoebophilaceae bacterium]
MSGHSKWANIKHRKGVNDAKKSKLFAKLVKELAIAAKQGSATPENNPRLRIAIQNARSANLPKDRIERAIKKGSSKESAAYTEVTYEGYAMYGVAVMVACMTDNLNRTVAAVRAIFNKYGGCLGRSGSLAFLFDKKGTFTLKRESVTDEETMTLAMIEAGAEAVEPEEDYFHITCPLGNFGQVQQGLEALRIAIDSASLQYVPNTSITLNESDAAKVMKLIDALEDHDDVQRAFHNMVNERPLDITDS